ncbi:MULTISPECIES: DMT family transporter [Paenibacillus]|uniref:QacE family quaternary ammonium compound efflux SMR transporter n=1 Tax=Paenibacillus borealis TaxID=160799 RepID=A0ABX3H2K2_PAEBO|nr:multidrug efflux SMR transporter [Paenibacillus borealis]OMD41555.1 QacE family quaternary ammonium compound efflux SMR transporter [Paenibacillus borealis]
MKAYLFLAVAVVSELFGTSLLKASEGLTRVYPSIGMVLCFGVAFYSLSLSLQQIPLGVAYAIWSGAGTALTVVIGIVVWKEAANVTTTFGILLIIAGVVLVNLRSA